MLVDERCVLGAHRRRHGSPNQPGGGKGAVMAEATRNGNGRTLWRG